MNRAFYAYPWNFHDLDRDLEKLDSLGIREITVAASYHAGKFIHPADAKHRVYFPEDGTVYFRPQSCYSGGLSPQVSTLTQTRDLLAELCDRPEIAVNAWMVLNHNTRLGTLNPEACVRNAFGDIYPYSLCPAQPSVKAYAMGICGDLASHYRVKSLLLETPGYLTFNHGFHHEFAQVAPSAWLDAMLGFCFCRACNSGAESHGVDVQPLRERIVRAVDNFLAGNPGNYDLAEWNQKDQDLAALHRWRYHVVTDFVTNIRTHIGPDTQVKVIASCQRPLKTAYLEGHDLVALDQACDGLELPLYHASPEFILGEAHYMLGLLSHKRFSVILRPGYPDLYSEADLEKAVRGLESLGIEDISFYNFGMLPSIHFEWIRNVLASR